MTEEEKRVLRDMLIERKCICKADYGKDNPFVAIYFNNLCELFYEVADKI